MTQDKPPEWAMKEALSLRSSPDLLTDFALALSQAYERGQVDMRERAAEYADEWEPVERLLPMASDEANEAAHTGQHEAAERIADAIRSLPIDSGKDA